MDQNEDTRSKNLFIQKICAKKMNTCASQEKIAFHWIIFVMELLIAKTMMMKLTVIGKGIKMNFLGTAKILAHLGVEIHEKTP